MWVDIECRKNKLYCLRDNHLKGQASIFYIFSTFQVSLSGVAKYCIMLWSLGV